MKRDAAFFDDAEPRLIYIARTLDDALAVEALLTETGVDYGVEADRYRGGVVFQSERVGAFFYVRPASESPARAVLEQRGFKTAAPEPPLK